MAEMTRNSDLVEMGIDEFKSNVPAKKEVKKTKKTKRAKKAKK